ncbi:hypothetical protein Tco_0010205 [Tanacetum coccineum]
MSSESTSSGTPRCLLTPSSKVKFKHHESNIAYNNVVALLEHHEPLFQPMLSFLSNCSICTALTKEPSAMYVEYIKDFWYTAEVDDTTKDISFSLSLFENQLSFTRFDFLTVIGLTDSKSAMPLPPKGTGSHNQMNFSQQTIAYCLIFGLEINIGDIIFKDLINKLQNGKKHKETNVCYTRYISLVLEQLLGENYLDESLTILKPHHILAASFQTPSASEVSLTSHMLKVTKLSKELDESLILPSGEVNVEATADKSQSETNVQPLSQPKAPTAKKSKKKKIPSSTQPKVSNDSREMNPPSTTTHLQVTEELVVTAVPTKSLEASVTAEVQDNQLKATDTTEVPEKIVEKEEVVEEQTLEIPTVVQLLDKVNKAAQETPQIPYDTERLSIPDHLDHICEEVSYLYSRLGNMKSSIVQTVFDEIKSSLPAMITNALKEQLPGILLSTLKDCLPLIVNESLQNHNLAVSEQFAETQAQLNKKVVKHLNKQFNISHVAQSNRFVTLQKELSKVIKSEVAKKVQVV